MVLTPFKQNKTQRLIAVLVMLAGFLLMIFTPTIAISIINIFILGAITSLVGFIYLLDAQ